MAHKKGMSSIQIAIDGPAGSGKSTIAKILADHLGFIYIDTGAMYRAVTLLSGENGIPYDDEEKLASLAAQAHLQLIRSTDGKQTVLCNGRDVTAEIRSPAVTKNVSLVASLVGVRRELVKKQQELAADQDVVMDGRDIGAVVLPEAQCKIYLTASIEERARRRHLELLEKGYQADYETIRQELQERDWLDQHRAADPLCPSPEAVVIDTTDLSHREVVEEILQIYRQKR